MRGGRKGGSESERRELAKVEEERQNCSEASGGNQTTSGGESTSSTDRNGTTESPTELRNAEKMVSFLQVRRYLSKKTITVNKDSIWWNLTNVWKEMSIM